MSSGCWYSKYHTIINIFKPGVGMQSKNTITIVHWTAGRYMCMCGTYKLSVLVVRQILDTPLSIVNAKG